MKQRSVNTNKRHPSRTGKARRRFTSLSGEPLETRTLLTFVPQLVADINTSPAGIPVSSSIGELNGYGYFASGSALWKSDGTTAVTSLVKEIADAGSPASVGGPTNLNGTLFFPAN